MAEQITVVPATETATPESVAPQNPLTQKFTEQEWTALKEFTVRVSAWHPLWRDCKLTWSLERAARDT